MFRRLPHRPAAEPANPYPSDLLEERMSGKLTHAPSSRRKSSGTYESSAWRPQPCLWAREVMRAVVGQLAVITVIC